MAATIADEDLAEDGREDRPHITVKYGIHTEEAYEVAAALRNEPGGVAILGATSLFQAKDNWSGADVVKIDVISRDLRRLNGAIASGVEVTDKYPVYRPHVTVAYVKPGRGQKYEGMDAVEGAEVPFYSITFSSKNGTEVDIPLLKGVGV